jgi:hypothetical protein
MVNPKLVFNPEVPAIVPLEAELSKKPPPVTKSAPGKETVIVTGLLESAV